MKKLRDLLLFAAMCISVFGGAQQSKTPNYPETRTQEVVETIHGIEVHDPYRWLEDSQSPETRKWIQDQSRFAKSLLDKRPEIALLRKQLSQLTNCERVGAGMVRDRRFFYMRKPVGRQLPALYMRTARRGRDVLLLEPSQVTGKAESIELLAVSQDGKLLAYGIRNGGQDEISIKFFDVERRITLEDMLPRGRYLYWTLGLLPDHSGVYYTKVLAEGPRVYFHRFGRNSTEDTIVFGSDLGADKLVELRTADDGRLLLIHVLHGAAGATDIYLKDLKSDAPIKPLVVDLPARFSARSIGSQIYLQTNWNAPNGKLYVMSAQNYRREQWRVAVKERHSVIQDFRLVGRNILVQYSDKAHSRLFVFSLTGKPLNEIRLPGLGTVSDIDGTTAQQKVLFVFTSFQVPPSLYTYSLQTRTVQEFLRPNMPEFLRSFRVEQVWFHSKDGTPVPMFLVHKPGIKKNGSVPTLLHGYGGFNWSQQPEFSPAEVAWVELGGLYAVANIRGGSEFGEEWHRAGMLDRKQKVFDDFIAGAEWLIRSQYTNPAKLAIEGISNGGLLVTASITQRPELFQAALVRYPLIDMVRYERFSIARWWATEYGSISNEKQFHDLYSYSPYHHVTKDVPYPAVLFVTGDGDTRVDPLHARKMAALMQASSSSTRPILLLYDLDSGHSGEMAAMDEIEQTTRELEFLIWQLGFDDHLPNASETD